MTAQVPSASRPVVFGAPLPTRTGSIASVIWHRLALIGIALVVILVIMPAVLGMLATTGPA